MPAYKLPDVSDVEEITCMLWDESGLAKETDLLDVDGNQFNVVATYISDEDELAAAVICDPMLASYSGASLTMVPKGVAEDAAKGEFTGPILENLHEIMNIFSRFFLDDTSLHLRLEKVSVGPASLPDKFREVLGEAGSSRGFEIDIPKYGNGRLRAIAL